MIQPNELKSGTGKVLWDVITAAATGATQVLERLLARDPSVSQRQYWYTQPLHFAVRAGHLDAARVLIDAGADPEWNGYYAGSLIQMARERGHEPVAQLLEQASRKRGRIPPHADHPIHEAAQKDDIVQISALLDADPSLVNRGDTAGGSPLHRAVMGSAHRAILLLLDRGADIHALRSTAPGAGQGCWAVDLQAIDLAIWAKRDFPSARMLLSRGAPYDLTIAAALGDTERVEALLHEDPQQIHEARANGRRPLTTAIEFGHRALARLLLERGADPVGPELGAEYGAALHAAAGAGDRELVELLLARGANPNGDVDSGGNAVFAAKTPELRALLIAHGGSLDPYDLVWMNRDDEVIRRVTANPESAERGCGGVFTAVCTRGKRELLLRLFAAGIRVPPVVTACQAYLLEDLELLPIMLANGMSPNLTNWQGQTLLHRVCGGGRGDDAGHAQARATLLLDAGASISAREEEYGSTPLAWAARSNMPQMVKFLLARGAAKNLPDDEPWATPLAWAVRRGNAEVVEILSS